MTKRYAVEEGKVLCYAQLTCPFCNAGTVENPTMPWCAACRVEYYEAKTEDPETGRRRFVFDNKRKTERFAFAKALNAAGGMRIGGKGDD